MRLVRYLKETSLALEIGNLYKTKKSAADKMNILQRNYNLPQSILKIIDDLSIDAFGYGGLGYRWFVNQVDKILKKKDY